MAKNVFFETSRKLSKIAEKHNSVIVSYSGGKDSLVVLDLCCRAFPRVICFFMYFVPGLKVIEQQLDFARNRYKVEILQYPHQVLLKCLKAGAFCPVYPYFADIPQYGVFDIQKLVMQDTGIDIVAHGAKKTDSIWRRRNLSVTSGNQHVIYPIVEWNKYDVLSYLKTHDIPLPDSQDGNATGVDLTTPSVLWLHDKHPEDYEKLLTVFPFVEAIVKRRDFFGVS